MFHWKRKLFADGGVLRDSGGGGGGGQPTQSTSYNTNVPEYARPYVENMLESTQKQIYNDDMTTFRPYTPYSNDVNNYFADFSPAQKYAQSETANMRTPGQYGAATGLTGLGTMGAFGLANQAAGAGQQYNQMAQDPSTMQGFMSPYMQNVVDYQKSQAIRDYGIGQQGLKAQAARSGAFGGSRQAIQEAEAQRSLGSQLQGITAQGSQQAFQNAQQAQQFGANLGLQGYQTGLQGINSTLQGAGQLAAIGGQQQASDLARLQAQQAVGQQQQTMEQNKINQAISNYATAQQYPFMQLGIMNSMLRGLPLQQTTTSSYQQQPSTAQQLTGLGGAALSYFGKKEGGIIGMKEGGTVPGYKYGTLINDAELQSISKDLSPGQLQGVMADPQVTQNERGIFDNTMRGNQYIQNNPMAAQQMAQMAAPPPQMAQAPSENARMGGIAAAGGDMFNTMGYAGGGIIAFAGEGPSLVKDLPDMSAEEYGKYISDVMSSDIPVDRKKRIAPMLGDALSQITKKENPTQEPKTEPTKTAFRGAAKDAAMPTNTREGMYAQTQEMMRKQGFEPGATAEEKALSDLYVKHQAGSKDVTSAQERANTALAFLKAGKNPRGFLPGAIEGAESYITGAGEIATKAEARETALAEARAKYAAGQRARAAGDMAASDKLFGEAAKLESEANIAKDRNAATLEAARGNNAAAIKAAEIHAAVSGQATKLEKEAMDDWLAKPENKGKTLADAYAAIKSASRGETNEIARLKAAIELKQKQLYGKTTPEQAAKIQQDIETLTQQLLQSGGRSTAAAPFEKAPTYEKGAETTYNGEKWRFKGGDQYDKKNWEKV
jgi:hypothetical protein